MDIATGKILRSWIISRQSAPEIRQRFCVQDCRVRAISADGKTAVWRLVKWADTGNGVGGDGSQVVIWDVSTEKIDAGFTDKDDKVFSGASVVLSSDGKYLTAHDRNSKMIVWEAANGQKLKTLGNGYAVEAVAYFVGTAAAWPRSLAGTLMA